MTTERLSNTYANDVPEDINLPGGTSHVVIIDTTSYSGNFERNMAAFAMGAFDEDRYHGAEEADVFTEDAEADPRLTAIQEKCTTISHSEYGDVSNTIWPTPGRLNTGMGRHVDDDGKVAATFPAYESVAVFVEEPLTDEELDLVKQRAAQYGVQRIDFGGKPDPVKVTGIRQLTFEVKRKVSVKRRR